MTENTLNQNTKYVDELIDAVEPDFNFSDKPLNRFKILENSYKNAAQNKLEKLLALKKKINSIENCKLKENSKKVILGDGNPNSPILLIGESPGKEEDDAGLSFQGDVGELLNKMLAAINIQRKKYT